MILRKPENLSFSLSDAHLQWYQGAQSRVLNGFETGSQMISNLYNHAQTDTNMYLYYKHKKYAYIINTYIYIYVCMNECMYVSMSVCNVL